jgi:hypothetical protein
MWRRSAFRGYAPEHKYYWGAVSMTARIWNTPVRQRYRALPDDEDSNGSDGEVHC